MLRGDWSRRSCEKIKYELTHCVSLFQFYIPFFSDLYSNAPIDECRMGSHLNIVAGQQQQLCNLCRHGNVCQSRPGSSSNSTCSLLAYRNSLLLGYQLTAIWGMAMMTNLTSTLPIIRFQTRQKKAKLGRRVILANWRETEKSSENIRRDFFLQALLGKWFLQKVDI